MAASKLLGTPTLLALLIMLVVVLTSPTPALAGSILLSESFDTDTADTSATLASYTDWSRTLAAGGVVTELVIIEGRVNMKPSGSFTDTLFDVAGFTGDLIITADIGRNSTSSSYNVGLTIGDNRLVFHPGFNTNTTKGFFRVEGPGGFSNQDMGFTTLANVMYQFEVSITAATGAFAITVTDPNDSNNVYNAAFTNSGYSPGSSRLGFRIEGPTSPTKIGFYDNFVVKGGSKGDILDGCKKGGQNGRGNAPGLEKDFNEKSKAPNNVCK